MKKLTSALFLLLISFCFILSGCGTTPLSMPENYTNPVSNGGFVVGAGNYIYFANAYKSNQNLTQKSDNDGSAVAQHSLKRIKLNTDHSWFNLEKDSDGKINYENVINKIAGFEVSNMYVVNNYLYFTSPNVHKNKENQHEFKLVSLFRIKLDGSGLTEIFTSKSESVDMYLTKNNTLVVFDDAKIQKADLSKNETSLTTIAESVESVVFPKQDGQDISWLYYTANRSDQDLISGNILKKVSLKANENKEVFKVAYETINLLAQDNGVVFYTKTGIKDSLGLYSYNGNAEVRHRTLTTGLENKSDLMFVNAENSDNNCFVFLYEDKLYVQYMYQTNDSQATQVSSETTSIHFSNGNYVYYSTEAGIYRYSVLTNTTKQISDHANIQNSSLDFDGRYVYYFVKLDGQSTETEYLYRADCYANQVKTECVAEVLANDVIEDEEQTEE